MMRRALLLLALLLSSLAFAQKRRPPPKDDDAPIPYDDDEEEPVRRELPRRSEETPTIREETDYEQLERLEVRAGLDDPNYGVSGELVTGLMLLEASQGSGVNVRFLWGLRATWEWGRLFSEEWLREALFADLTWSYSGLRDGTEEINADTNYHYFTVAQAWAWPLGNKSNFAAYVQGGFGLGYQFSAIRVKAVETQIAGTKTLLQYGVGIRGRPALLPDESIRLSFRFELTRFLRGYMHDTFLGGSVGATF